MVFRKNRDKKFSSDKNSENNNASLEDIDEKIIINDINSIYDALDDGTLNLNPDDESQLRDELNLILSNVPSDKNKGREHSFSSLYSDFVEQDVSEEVVSDVVGDDVSEEVVSDVVGDDVSEDEVISVDDALGDLIEDYSNDFAISVENLSMDYKVSKDKIDTLKEFFIRTLKRNKKKTKTISALKDISFNIPKGDRVGIIGFNGAGKSTLLKLLAGIYSPTSGNIKIKGKIAPLLELGAGFDMNYTGHANIFLYGAFLGYSEEFLKEKYDEIVEFSELEESINYHVKTYSSGMRAKLGFSIATIVEPDILIIDEILSVGDIKFQRKSSDKLRSLINSGITVLLVSHSVAQIRDLCNKAMWIDDGELKMFGDVNLVCDEYVKAANNAAREQLKNININ